MDILKHLREAIILVFLAVIGNLLVRFFHAPISGNVLGFALVTLAITMKILPASWFGKISRILVRHMGLFFVPVAAGVIVVEKSLGGNALAYIFILFISTLGGMTISAVITHVLSRGKSRENNALIENPKTIEQVA